MLTPSFRPQYRNQLLLNLFSHYKEAWSTWYVEAVQGSNRIGKPWFCYTLATSDSGHLGLMSSVLVCANSTPLLNIYLAQGDNDAEKHFQPISSFSIKLTICILRLLN